MKHNFKKLDIWKKGRVLVKVIYNVTKVFPDDEKYGLTSQMRRCAVSIPSNIAEGCGRNTDKDLSRFLHIAIGSICELETQLYLSHDVGYIDEKETDKLIVQVEEIRRMITGFIKKLNINYEK